MSDPARTHHAGVRIITLGDGDFTYSLDLARYLSESATFVKLELIATGIDSKEDLFSKYKDAPYILDQLMGVQSHKISCSLRHDTNAIVPKTPDKQTMISQSPGHADHVMFHHPHLGTENAVLHSKFLCHFFHSCAHYWMALPGRGSLVYVTLVDGQYERWNCADAASRHGLVLVQRFPFSPPHVKAPTYHYRRHQTGKSFESRRPHGSETFVFGRKIDQESVDLVSRVLYWQPKKILEYQKEEGSPRGKNKLVQREPLLFSCPHCEKEFKEARSLKCHLRDKHPDGPDKKAKREDIGPKQYFCNKCKCEETGEHRIFGSAQALKDHLQAKHTGIHETILPDWHQCPQIPQQIPSGLKECNNGARFGACFICGAAYMDSEHETRHLADFVPLKTVEKYSCTFCSKTFRELRAKLQHENFCSKSIK